VATISRLLKSIRLFCKRAQEKRQFSAKEPKKRDDMFAKEPYKRDDMFAKEPYERDDMWLYSHVMRPHHMRILLDSAKLAAGAHRGHMV